MGNLARRKMAQRLTRAFVRRNPDQRFIRGERPGLGRDVRAQITHHAGAFVHITRIPGRALRIHQMRTVAAHGKQRAVERLLLRALLGALGVLLDHQRHHFQMAELLGGDVLQHVADALVLGVEGLGEVGQRRRQFAGRAAELLEQLFGEHRIWRIYAHLMQRVGSMNEHGDRPSRVMPTATAATGAGWPFTRKCPLHVAA